MTTKTISKRPPSEWPYFDKGTVHPEVEYGTFMEGNKGGVERI
jgi:hypothetical protein